MAEATFVAVLARTPFAAGAARETPVVAVVMVNTTASSIALFCTYALLHAWFGTKPKPNAAPFDLEDSIVFWCNGQIKKSPGIRPGD